MKILAIIPARGGSKGVKDKNIRILNGKPLIAWTIEEAKKSKCIDRLIVTTDDDRIAKIAREYGADVPFKRPAELATDTTPGIEPVLHAIKHLKAYDHYDSDYVMLLQCTSPLRNVRHIDEAIDLLLKSDADSLASVTKLEHPPHWNKVIDENGFLQDFIEYNSHKKARRQDFEDVYRLNGAIYISNTNLVMSEKNLLVGDIFPFIMDGRESVDIDEEFNFQLAEFINSKRGGIA